MRYTIRRGHVGVIGAALVALTMPAAATAQSGRRCAAERDLYSQNSNERTRLTIVNDAPFPVRVYWINFNGARTPFARLTPGQSFRATTFASHPWVITDLADNCRQVVFAESGNQVFRFSGSGSYQPPVEPRPYNPTPYNPRPVDGPDTVEPLSEGDAYRQIDVPVGQEMTIALPSNASTGYHWEAVLARNVSLLGRITEERPRGALIGGGGTSLVSFRVNRPGYAEVTLLYVPPGGGPAGKTLVYKFRGI